MATLHTIPLSAFPSDWDSETYSDATFLSLIESGRTISETLSDGEIMEMESITDYGDGEYPAVITSRYKDDMIGNFLFIVTDDEAFPKSVGEIRGNLSFPVIDNFCYNAENLRGQIAYLTRHLERAQAMLDNLR
jgi:hypothetical protein